jgi:hypothetical protein
LVRFALETNCAKESLQRHPLGCRPRHVDISGVRFSNSGLSIAYMVAGVVDGIVV